MSKQTVLVDPKLLKWVTSRMGWELDELAKKANIPIESIIDPKSKKCEIKVNKLEKIAKELDHPITAFFLPKPPIEPEIPNFRKLPNAQEKPSKKTCLAIRQARRWQAISKKLLQIQSQSLRPKIRNYSINDNPETVAHIERERLGFESEVRLRSNEAKRSVNNFYNELRNGVESYNIFVYQLPIPVEESRGFTLPTGLPYIIVVSSLDSIKARIFTLLHEYAHLLIREVGICLPDLKTKSPDKTGQRIETWCNDFAGSVLMPKKKFLERINEYEERKTPNEIITKLSSEFKTSEQAVMVRVMRLSGNTPFARSCKDRFDSISDRSSKKKGGTGGPSPAVACKSRRGAKFVRLILDAREKRLITHADALIYLNLNPKYLDKLTRIL